MRKYQKTFLFCHQLTQSLFFYSDDRAKKSKQEEEYYGLAQTYGYSPEDLGVDSGRGFGRGRGGRGGGRQAPYPMGGRGGFGGGQGGYQTTPLVPLFDLNC